MGSRVIVDSDGRIGTIHHFDAPDRVTPKDRPVCARMATAPFILPPASVNRLAYRLG